MYIEDDILLIYNDIFKHARKWLTIMGLETLPEFAEWLVRNQSTVVSFQHGYIILDEYVQGVRVTAHPCFVNVKGIHDKEMLVGLLDGILRICDVHRLQIRVSDIAGHTIRSRLRELGFVKEAVLQNYTLDRTILPNQLLSVEIWAILK